MIQIKRENLGRSRKEEERQEDHILLCILTAASSFVICLFGDFSTKGKRKKTEHQEAENDSN